MNLIQYVTFTLCVRNQNDPVAAHLSDALSLRIIRFEIENLRSLNEWEFIRSIIGEIKIDRFVIKIDYSVTAQGAEEEHQFW